MTMAKPTSPKAEIPRHPFQPLYIDANGAERFKENAIVRYLLDNGGIDMNDLARVDFSRNDREQFAQLIGYSLCGFSELSYVSDETYSAAQQCGPEADEHGKRAAALREKLDELKLALREPIAHLYGLHPDDLPLDK